MSDLANALSLEKALVSKNLSRFRESGFLQQDARTKVYSPAIRSFLLGSRFLSNNLLVQEAGSELRRLVERTGQTSTLCILEGSDVVHLASVEGAGLPRRWLARRNVAAFPCDRCRKGALRVCRPATVG